MLITHANLITWEKPNRILLDQAVLIEGSLIREFGPNAEMVERYSSIDTLDAGGKYVMPGNICAHTHFYGAYSRGMAIHGSAPDAFPEILEKLWWPLDKALTEETVRYSTLVCLIDAIRHGTTTLIDHHASPNAIPGSLDIIAQAVDEAGLRADLCYEVTDRDGPEKARQGIAENARFIDAVRKDQPAEGRISAHFGLHASLTLSDATLQASRDAIGSESGFHVHVAEHPVDEYDSLAKSGMRVVDRLAKHEILGPHTIVAHAVHIDLREAELLQESGAWVTHQPRSNMNNAVGVAPVESYLRAGIKVCLGNDGFSNTMWDEWKAAYLVHKIWNRDPRRMSGSDVAEMAVYNNADLATQIYGNVPVGKIVPGAYADLIFVDYHPYTPLTADNLPWQILFGFHESMITTTIVAGKVLMHNRELMTLDEEAISRRALELAPQVWQAYEQHFSE
ncbi:MAG TPA: putative aminohydrolase SsnA [Anaerolineaceae bacterium]|nr:putative aminohydrolase SsnA [Anaerolineaceae bacterium]